MSTIVQRSEVAICNLALAEIGRGLTITSLDENSQARTRVPPALSLRTRRVPARSRLEFRCGAGEPRRGVGMRRRVAENSHGRTLGWPVDEGQSGHGTQRAAVLAGRLR
jgi:hypothetical protein